MAHSCAELVPRVNRVSGIVVNAEMQVHSVLGPGLLESAYQVCLAHELRKRGLQVETQMPLPVVSEGEKLEAGYRIDLLVEGLVVVEIKCVEAIHPVHQAQLLSYLRLSGRHVGLLISFYVAHLKDGITRLVDGYNGTDRKGLTTGDTGEHREFEQENTADREISGRDFWLSSVCLCAPLR
jgi:GxxExxY protein